MLTRSSDFSKIVESVLKESLNLVKEPVEVDKPADLFEGKGILHVYTYTGTTAKQNCQVGIYFPRRIPRKIVVRLTDPSRPIIDKFVAQKMGGGKKIYYYTGIVPGIGTAPVFIVTDETPRPFHPNSKIDLKDPSFLTKDKTKKTVERAEKKLKM